MQKASKYLRVTRGVAARGAPDHLAFSGAINTERLRLRQLIATDAPTIAGMVSDWEVSKQTVSIANPYTLQNARDFVSEGEAGWLDGSQFVLGMERKLDHRLIGTVSVQIYRKWGLRYGEIGYWAGRDHWGQGYTSEAVEAFLIFCKTTLGLGRIAARVFAENEASIRLLRSNGFRAVSSRMENLPQRGGRRRIIVLRYKSN